MLVIGILFLLGASSVQLLSALPSFSFIYLILSSIVLCGYIKRLRLIAVALGGFAYAFCFAHMQIDQQLPKELENQVLQVEGLVVSVPMLNRWGQSFEFEVENFDIQALPKGLNKIRLNWYDLDKHLKLGQRWRLHVKLKRPHGVFNEAGFNYETWLWVNQFNATGTVVKSDLAQSIGQTGNLFYRLRQYYIDSLDKALNAVQNKAFFKALSVADKSGLSEQHKRLFQETGTAHLFAISGLHIGLASLFFWYLGCMLWYLGSCLFRQYSQLLPRPVLAASFALLGALFYAVLAGFTVPTTRAFIVVAILMLAVILQRSARWQQTLGWALILVVLHKPFSLLNVGFCLSFLAVIVIAYVSFGRKQRTSKLAGRLYIFSKIQLALSVILLPLLVLFFGKAALVGTVANFVAVPLASFLIVPMVLILLLLVPFQGIMPVFVDFYVTCLDALFTLFIKLMKVFHHLPLSYANIAQPSIWVVSVTLLAAFVFFMPKAVPGRRLVCLLLLPFIWPVLDKLETGHFLVDVIDVGQGLSILVRTQQHTLLYDTGPAYPGGFNAGSDIIAPLLRSKQIHKLDKVLVSHGDLDHRGGLMAVQQSFLVKEIMSNVSKEGLMLDDSHIDKPVIKGCWRQGEWQWDGVHFEILHPPPYWFTVGNNASCVLRIDNGDMSILIPGDIEWLAEYELVDYLSLTERDIRSDILISPHHGSKSSSTEHFVDLVEPSWVVHSAGYLNRFKLPSPSVERRYAQIASQQLNTAESGQVLINSSKWPASEAISVLRSQKKRFWYWQQNKP